MQSFKQFLKENNNTSVHFCISLTNDTNSDIIEILEQLQNKGYAVDLDEEEHIVNGHTLYFEIKNQEEASNYQKIVDETIKVIQSLLGNGNYLDDDAFFQVYDLNFNFFIDCKLVTLYFTDPNITSLKDIHKKINCEFLSIFNPVHIKSNALSILKIPKLTTFWAYGTTIKNIKANFGWLNIIKKYLKSKDIVECAQELIENNLKEYAKL